MLIDTHCHLDFERFDEDRDVVVERAREAGVVGMVVPSLDLTNAATVLDLTSHFEDVFVAVGIHPNSATGWQDSWLEQVRRFAGHPKVVAIGEIGLDYYWDKTPVDLQQKAFSQQLVLARDLLLPVIIHNREASQDVLTLLANSPLAGRPNPGVLHSFSGSWETAAAALEMGFYIGITGPVTFKKADDLREIVARVPADRLLVETDAPFLTPAPNRGRRNEPAYVRNIAEKIAEVRHISYEELAATTTRNAVRLFNLAAVREKMPAQERHWSIN